MYCGGIAREASVAPFTRSGRASSIHTQLLQKVTFTCGARRRRHIIVSEVTAIGTCERADGEENVGRSPRGCHWFETSARTDRSLFSRADKNNRQKNISFCIEITQKKIILIPLPCICYIQCTYAHGIADTYFFCISTYMQNNILSAHVTIVLYSPLDLEYFSCAIRYPRLTVYSSSPNNK